MTTTVRRIDIPSDALVLLVGAPGSGKSTWANRHFSPNEIVSTDHYRAVLANDESNLDVSAEAFSLVRQIAESRLSRGLLTVVDSTGNDDIRLPLLRAAGEMGRPVVAVVLDFPEEISQQRNRGRDRKVPEHVISSMVRRVHARIKVMRGEQFAAVEVFRNPNSLDRAVVARTAAPELGR